MGAEVTTIIVRDEVLRQRAIYAIRSLSLDVPSEVVIQPWKKKRSSAANRLMWLWNTQIRDHIRETTGGG